MNKLIQAGGVAIKACGVIAAGLLVTAAWGQSARLARVGQASGAVSGPGAAVSPSAPAGGTTDTAAAASGSYLSPRGASVPDTPPNPWIQYHYDRDYGSDSSDNARLSDDSAQRLAHLWSRFGGRGHGPMWWDDNQNKGKVTPAHFGWEPYRGYVNWDSYFPLVFYPSLYGTSYPWYLKPYYSQTYSYPNYSEAAYGYQQYAGYPNQAYGYTTGSSLHAYVQLSGSNAYTDNSISPAIASPPPGAAAYDGSGPGAAIPGGQRYYDDALIAFQQGDYQQATRLLAHGVVEMPGEVKFHELMSLTLLALTQYRAASMEAHATLALGPAPDWPALMAFYQNDPEIITRQLRALEAFTRENPSSPDARFLMGYAYLMMGYRQPAQEQFAAALKLVPQDKLALQLMAQIDSGALVIGGTGG